MLKGLLFDKDGTLFDFAATWNTWALGVMHELSGGDQDCIRAMARATRYDLENRRYLPDSPVIAGTNREAAELLLSQLPGRDLAEVERILSEAAARAPLVPATPLVPLLDGLRDRGLALGVMTNDSEFSARAQLRKAGVEDYFPFLAGFDSGHGSKPDPDPLLAFARHAGLRPRQVAMIGDSTHDLIAGRAAGMFCVGVLTGVAPAEELTPYAHIILPDIGHIPSWLDSIA